LKRLSVEAAFFFEYFCEVKNRFLKYILQKQLFDKEDKLLVAVSGGIDSVVLLHLLLELKFDVAIAHCNFLLRGSESDEDEKFVRALVLKYEVEIFVKKCDAGKYASQKKISIQESARELRYNWFEELVMQQGFSKLVVGHHFDDNLETFFINFSRGSGLSGLRGIPLENNNIVRPLMFASREQIEMYATENNLNFREDSSNKSDKYLRNNLRHNVIPSLKTALNDSVTGMEKSLEYLAEDEMLFEQLMDEKRNELIEEGESQIVIDKKKLQALSPLKVWLFYLLKPFGFPRGLTDEIAVAIEENKSGRQFFSPTHRLVTDRKKLFLNLLDENHELEEYFIEEGEVEILEPVHLRFSTLNISSGFKIDTNRFTAQLDYHKLEFPLTLRKWKTSDSFHPLGMKGSKLLSDFFIDNKLSIPEKENTWLLVSGSQIVWVVGMRISDKFKVEKSSSTVLKIEWTPAR